MKFNFFLLISCETSHIYVRRHDELNGAVYLLLVQCKNSGPTTMVYRLINHAGCWQNTRRIDQFRYIKIQPKTIDLSVRLRGITTEFVGYIRQCLVLRSIVLG